MGYLTCCLSNGSSFGSSMQYLVIRLFTSPSNMTPIGLIKLVAMPFTHLLTPLPHRQLFPIPCQLRNEDFPSGNSALA